MTAEKHVISTTNEAGFGNRAGLIRLCLVSCGKKNRVRPVVLGLAVVYDYSQCSVICMQALGISQNG
jgi:hypothetical protein